MNEAGVGEGIRSCGVAREELYITTKVAAEVKTYEVITQSIDESLAKMGLDYVDLLIIHSLGWSSVRRTGTSRRFSIPFTFSFLPNLIFRNTKRV